MTCTKCDDSTSRMTRGCCCRRFNQWGLLKETQTFSSTWYAFSPVSSFIPTQCVTVTVTVSMSVAFGTENDFPKWDISVSVSLTSDGQALRKRLSSIVQETVHSRTPRVRTCQHKNSGMIWVSPLLDPINQHDTRQKRLKGGYQHFHQKF